MMPSDRTRMEERDAETRRHGDAENKTAPVPASPRPRVSASSSPVSPRLSVSASSSPILPGSTLGVLGSGQLGRMFAIAARRMGYRVHTFSPDSDTPTGQVADLEVEALYDDLDAVRNFARGVSVVTFEFENVPTATAEAAAEFTLVRPAGSVLHTTQHRLREKTFLAESGFPVTPFRAIRSIDDVRSAVSEFRASGCAEDRVVWLRRQGAEHRPLPGRGRAGVELRQRRRTGLRGVCGFRPRGVGGGRPRRRR